MITRDRNVINITEEGDWLDESVCVQAIRLHSVPGLAMAVAEINEKPDASGEMHFRLEARRGHPDFVALPVSPVWLHGGFKVTRLDGGKITMYAAYLSKRDDEI